MAVREEKARRKKPGRIWRAFMMDCILRYVPIRRYARSGRGGSKCCSWSVSSQSAHSYSDAGSHVRGRRFDPCSNFNFTSFERWLRIEYNHAFA
jgi:hypothetical protein